MANQNVRNLTMQQKRGTSMNFIAKNPVLLAGEIAIVTDLGKMKVGNGVDAYNDLPFVKVSVEDIIDLCTNGKINASLLPDLAIGTVKPVAYTDTETVGEDGVVAFKGITAAESGDFAVVTTEKGASETDAAYLARQTANGDGVYIYAGNTSGSEAYNTANWVLIKVPGSAVQSVNGKVGASITLSTDDIGEGSSNLYFTEERAQTAAKKLNSTEFADGDSVLHNTDTLIIDAGEVVADAEPSGN